MYLQDGIDIYKQTPQGGRFNGITDSAIEAFEWKMWNLVDRGLPFWGQLDPPFSERYPIFDALRRLDSLDEYNIVFTAPNKCRCPDRFFREYSVDSAYNIGTTYNFSYQFLTETCIEDRRRILTRMQRGSDLFVDVRGIGRDQFMGEGEWARFIAVLNWFMEHEGSRLRILSAPMTGLSSLIELHRQKSESSLMEQFVEQHLNSYTFEFHMGWFIRRDGSPQDIDKIPAAHRERIMEAMVEPAKVEEPSE